ncbi:hypothetical protein E3Q17_01205 [Wallemia mellicola]|uniref:Uncharacterized protein n=1 Tax=Wallemia mellicola TaxID=1708541 RepID=A0A4T0NZ34_9BASI|nr:hypothetical protein E3Q17_01205 [Wallemia mellicola]
MKLNGKQSTNTLNNWLPNWLQPLVDERTAETNLNSNESSNMNDNNDNTRNDDDHVHSTTTTIRNITPTIQQEKPPAPPRFNEPYFNINEYNNPSKFTYSLYLIVIYIHLPVSIFFDANSIYVLTNLLKFNNWIWALVVYCVSLAAMWFIVLVSDIHSYRLFWNLRRPPIYKAYTTPKLFNLTCSKSLQHFRLLFSIRKLAYQSISVEIFHLEGLLTLVDYPIILTCVPRAAISLALILQFWNPSFLPIIENAFFERDAQLSRYAQGVLITHVVWVGLRLLVVVVAFLSHYSLSSSMFGTPLPYDDKEALNYALENNHSWAWKERMVHRIEEVFRRGINPSAQEKRFSWSIRERPTTWTPNQVRLQDRQRLRRCSSNSDSVIVTSRSAPVVRITEHSLVPTPIMTDDRRGSVATRSNSLNTMQQEAESDVTSAQSREESQESSQVTQDNNSSHEQSPTNSIGLFSNASWHTPEREPTVASHSRSNGTSPRVGPARESTTSMSSVGALVNNNNGNSLPRDESYGSLPVPPLPASTSAEPALTQEGSSGSQSNGNDNSNTNHSRQSSYERDLIASESRDALGPIQSTSRMLDDFSYTPEREVQPSSNSNNSGSSSDLSNHSNNSHSSSSLSRMSSFFARKLKKKRSSSQTVLAQSREPGEGNQYNVNQDGVETENVSPPPPYTPTVSHSESRETIEQTSTSPEVVQRSQSRQSRQSRQSQRSSAIPIGLGLREEDDDADDENDSSNNNSDGIDWNTLRVESKRRLQDEQEQQSERRYEQ